MIVIKEIFNLDYSDILYLSAKVVEYDWLGTDKENSGENILSPRVQAKVEQMMEDSDDHKLWRIASERLRRANRGSEIQILKTNWKRLQSTKLLHRSVAKCTSTTGICLSVCIMIMVVEKYV